MQMSRLCKHSYFYRNGCLTVRKLKFLSVAEKKIEVSFAIVMYCKAKQDNSCMDVYWYSTSIRLLSWH